MNIGCVNMNRLELFIKLLQTLEEKVGEIPWKFYKDICLELASNINTPKEILTILAQYNDIEILLPLVRRKELSEDIIALLFEKHLNAIDWELAHHPNIPIKMLESLATNASPLIREMVANNPRISSSITKLLVTDSDARVRRALFCNSVATKYIVESILR